MFKTVGAAVVALAVLVCAAGVGTIAYNAYEGERSASAARSLCRTIPIGADVGAVVEAAAQRHDGNRLEIYEGEHHFRFQAGLLNTYDCAATTVDGKVVAVRVFANDD